jgi:hypothetical protein
MSFSPSEKAKLISQIKSIDAFAASLDRRLGQLEQEFAAMKKAMKTEAQAKKEAPKTLRTDKA